MLEYVAIIYRVLCMHFTCINTPLHSNPAKDKDILVTDEPCPFTMLNILTSVHRYFVIDLLSNTSPSHAPNHSQWHQFFMLCMCLCSVSVPSLPYDFGEATIWSTLPYMMKQMFKNRNLGQFVYYLQNS
jgi:hypothetical protein